MPGQVLGGDGLGRVRWKQGTGGGKGASTVSSPPPQGSVGGSQRNNNDSGFERTSSLGGDMVVVSSGCNATTRGCIECSGGLVLQEGKCKSPCPRQRFYASPACLPCHYSCKSCSGPNDYECTECFEDATPSLFHTINQTSASSFRCISSDVFQALLSEHWYFWFFIAILCATALILFVIVLLCYQRCSAGHHPQVEGHIYHKLGTRELHTNEKRREPIVGESSDDEDIP